MEGLAIIAIVILNAAIGLIQEHRADAAMAALKKMAAPDAQVLRDGMRIRVPVREMVSGDIVFLEIETVGETLNKEEVLGTIEAVKTVSDMFMPVGGEILEVNPALELSPDTVNKDPYGKGWIVRIKMTNPEEVNELLTSEKYLTLL